MLDNITSLTGKGLKDWFIQRLSAVMIGAYAIFLLVYLMLHPGLNYADWLNLYECTWMIIWSLLVLLSLLLHTWVGIWTVTTDYLKCTTLRLSVQMLVLLVLLASFVWGIQILWGV